MSEKTYRLANEADVPALKALWASAFPEDDAADIDAFFARFFSKCAIPLVCEDGVAVSMLFLIPQTLRCRAATFEAAYIYAGATRPDRQGHGLYRSLLTFAGQVAQGNGAEALFLRPASSRLEESYRRMGFTVPMMCDCVDALEKSDLSLSELSATAYVERRGRLLDRLNVSYVDWDTSVVAHALRWCRAVACGGETCALISADDGRVWEYLSTDGTARLPFAAQRCRRPGDTVTIGLLKPLCDTDFTAYLPMYMGYGLE